jgi:squalene-hopene/tetraprenyl-beta-curcumene cyclase
MNSLKGDASLAVDFNASTAPIPEDVLARLDATICKAQNYLLDKQHPDGYWVGELEADASVSAGYIPLIYFMTGEVEAVRQTKVVNYVLSQQNKDGSWSAYPGGPGDLNVSIQAYFGLKMGGVSGDEICMQRGRGFILSHGGISQANVFVKIWLALFGQFDWQSAPSIPVELIFLPDWFYLNLYEFSSWSRATIVALMLTLALKPVCVLPESAQIGELYIEPAGKRVFPVGTRERWLSWKSMFLLLDTVFKIYERLPIHPGRQRAMKAVEQWILDHQEADGSWGGIMLPWIYSLMVLKSLGYDLDHPAIARGLAGIEDFIVEDESTLRLQPAVSPVWDTAWTVIALRETGLPEDHPALKKAVEWLLEKEIRSSGDWQRKNPSTSPGCWAFEFENNQYPDLDDSAVVPRALMKVELSEAGQERKKGAIQRAVNWILDMQSKDGGWAAFDRDNDRWIITQVPYVDFMSPLDPTCPDVTAHVVELLVEIDHQNPSLARALDYLYANQEPDGAWFGRWGVNYIYGTSLVLSALGAAGEALDSPPIKRAAAWLRSIQNSDGGWGETCGTYDDPTLRGIGASTASQTAWALIGLLAAGDGHNSRVQAGVEFILSNQAQDGSWPEVGYTGTGFPNIFYLRYDYYRIYFPMIALARYREQLQEAPR